jgi:hypothetical protein
MDAENTPTWTLTDEEWCEISFLLIELGEAQQQFQDIMLAEERPSMNQLWQKASAYQLRSQALFNYIGSQLRHRALHGEKRAA